MNPRAGIIAVSLVLATLAVAAPASPAPARLIFEATSGSTVRIAGRATLGDWTCQLDEIIATIAPGPALEALAQRISVGETLAANSCASGSVLPTPAPPDALITIPLRALRCDKPGMRDDVLTALRYEDAPLIVFLLTAVTDVKVQPRGAADLGRYVVAARGNLVLAGATRPIELAAQVVQETPRRFRVDATKALRMSDFGITPPSAFFGLIRADDAVTVSFHLIFEARER